MAESGLPAGLEKLKIDLKRDLDDCGTSIDLEVANPFSVVSSGARKKIRKAAPAQNIEERHSCSVDIFGADFSESTSTSALCQCNVYVPTKFRNHGKRFSSGGNLLQVKSTSVFKKNILQKSKLNFLKLHDVTKQSCQQVDPLTLTHNAKSIHLRDSEPSSEAICKINPSKCSVQSQPTTIAVQDFKSLISSSEKQISTNNNNPIFETLSFKSLQNSKLRRRHYVERSPAKSDEDDLVNSVSKKLSVTGISSNNKASCSQEARLTANAYCDEHDISIDELASYFEDFVHIPKKMSLMAEQMYI